MPLFLHLTSEKNRHSIRRVGIRLEAIHSSEFPKGIFCMPVISDYYATHQWARELMRFGLRNPCAVYFRVPDHETVWFGRYNDHHAKATADQAVDAFAKAKERMGFQVILPRKVLPGEILRTRPVAPLGWRFHPAAKGTRPCLCPACIGRGEYGSHKMLTQKLEEHYFTFRHAESTAEKCAALQEMATLIDDHQLKFENWQELLQEETLRDALLFEIVSSIIAAQKNRKALPTLFSHLERHPPKTQEAFVWQVLSRFPEDGETLLAPVRHLSVVAEQVEAFNSL